MTLPVELLQRRRPAERVDAVIVGAGVPGLVTACMLAGTGLRVVVVDDHKRPGGALQTLAYQGYAVDLAPPLFEAPVFAQVLAAAGVREHGLCEVPSAAIQVAMLGEKGIASAPRVAPVPGTVPSPSTLDAVRELFGVPPRVFAALGAVYQELIGASAEQVEDWHGIDLGTWLSQGSFEPAVQAAALRSIALLGAGEPARANLVSVVLRLREREQSGLSMPGDQPIAGARGIVQALVDRFIDAGGELRLGTRAVGMAVDGRRFATLAVQREAQPFTEEIAADRCVLALGCDSLPAVLPRELLEALALSTSTAAGALLGVAFAMAEEAPFADAEQAWVVRVLPAGGVPTRPSEISGGTFLRVSAAAPRLAPPGRALVLAWTHLESHVARDARLVLARAGHLRTALEQLLGPAAPAIEWQRHWLGPEPGREALLPGIVPWVVPGFEGIYLVNPDLDLPGRVAGGLVAAAAAGRQVAERILSGS